MPTIVVDVMPKAELLDPQGKATTGALARLGHGKFHDVRIGEQAQSRAVVVGQQPVGIARRGQADRRGW